MANEETSLRARHEKVLSGDGVESRSCKQTDCVFHRYVATGGMPCSECRNLVKGDFYVVK